MKKNTKLIIEGIACGLFASWIKSLAEPPLQELGESKYPPTKKELDLYGADVTRQPEKMPPSILAQKVYKNVTHKELGYKSTLKSMKGIHYGLGAVIGLAYVFLSRKEKKLRVLDGIPAGAGVWALTHGSVVPKLGLQGPVSKMPKSWWVWEFGSHLVFGLALEKSRKAFHKLLK